MVIRSRSLQVHSVSLMEAGWFPGFTLGLDERRGEQGLWCCYWGQQMGFGWFG